MSSRWGAVPGCGSRIQVKKGSHSLVIVQCRSLGSRRYSGTMANLILVSRYAATCLQAQAHPAVAITGSWLPVP